MTDAVDWYMSMVQTPIHVFFMETSTLPLLL